MVILVRFKLCDFFQVIINVATLFVANDLSVTIIRSSNFASCDEFEEMTGK